MSGTTEVNSSVSSKRTAADNGSDSEADRETQFGNDASNGLSYTKMMFERDQNHPRDAHDVKRQMSICGTKTGCHSCFSRESRKSEFE